MQTKEEYYESMLENRKLVNDPKITTCTCPNTLCDWHGKCRECVALHRHYADHIPACLQPIIRGKLKQLVGVSEMIATPKEGTPLEYRQFVRERDRDSASRSE